MLTAGADHAGRAVGEVRPHPWKTGWTHPIGGDHGGRSDDDAAADATDARRRLPVGPQSGYSAVRQGQIRRTNGKCRFKQTIGWTMANIWVYDEEDRIRVSTPVDEVWASFKRIFSNRVPIDHPILQIELVHGQSLQSGARLSVQWMLDVFKHDVGTLDIFSERDRIISMTLYSGSRMIKYHYQIYGVSEGETIIHVRFSEQAYFWAYVTNIMFRRRSSSKSRFRMVTDHVRKIIRHH